MPVDSVIIDNPIYTNNAKEYTITNDNYGNYFDNETGTTGSKRRSIVGEVGFV